MEQEEEFIDMVLSPPLQSKNKEFEFQMCKISIDKQEFTPSPADELFYKGKLLPLHLPPRLQMLQNLLKTPISPHKKAFEEDEEVGFELNPDGYFLQWSNGVHGLTKNGDTQSSRKPWKVIKKLAFSQKIKSFFTRSDVVGPEVDDSVGFTCHRLSFSRAMKGNCTSSKKNSSLVKPTKGFCEISLLSENEEKSVEGAIDYCKKSLLQQKNGFLEEKGHQSEVQESRIVERGEEER